MNSGWPLARAGLLPSVGLIPAALTGKDHIRTAGIVSAEDHMAAVPVEIRAIGNLGLPGRQIPFPGVAVLEITLKPVKFLLMTRLTTPATASEPQAAEAPPVTTSTRWMRLLGMVERSTPPVGLECDHALAVEQDQGADHAQVAKIDGIDAGDGRDDIGCAPAIDR